MMGYEDSDSSCKTHPNLNQQQLPGVCPSCLRDRHSTLVNYSSFHEEEFRDSSVARISDPFPAMKAFSRNLNGSSDVFLLRRGISKSVRLTNVDVDCDGKSKYLGFNLNKSRSAAAASSTTRPYSYRGSGSRRSRHGKGDGHDLSEIREKAGNLKKGTSTTAGFWKKLISSKSKKMRNQIITKTTTIQ